MNREVHVRFCESAGLRCFALLAYLHAYASVPNARASIRRYLDLYNRRCPHSSLDGMTPDQAYYGAQSLPPVRLAA
jgi:putative transposase